MVTVKHQLVIQPWQGMGVGERGRHALQRMRTGKQTCRKRMTLARKQTGQLYGASQQQVTQRAGH